MKISRKIKFLKIAFLAAALQTLSFGLNAMAMEDQPKKQLPKTEQTSKKDDKKRYSEDDKEKSPRKEKSSSKEKKKKSKSKEKDSESLDETRIESEDEKLEKQEEKRLDEVYKLLKKRQKDIPTTMKDFIIDFVKKNPNATPEQIFNEFYDLPEEKRREILKNTDEHKDHSFFIKDDNVRNDVTKAYEKLNKKIDFLQRKRIYEDSGIKKKLDKKQKKAINVMFISTSFGFDELGACHEYAIYEPQNEANKNSKYHIKKELDPSKVIPGLLTEKKDPSPEMVKANPNIANKKYEYFTTATINATMTSSFVKALIEENNKRPEKERWLLILCIDFTSYPKDPNFSTNNINAFLRNNKIPDDPNVCVIHKGLYGKPMLLMRDANFYSNGGIGFTKKVFKINKMTEEAIVEGLTNDYAKKGIPVNLAAININFDDSSNLEDQGIKTYIQVDEYTSKKTQQNSLHYADLVNKYVGPPYNNAIEKWFASYGIKSSDIKKPIDPTRAEFWGVTNLGEVGLSEDFKDAEQNKCLNVANILVYINYLQNSITREAIMTNRKLMADGNNRLITATNKQFSYWNKKLEKYNSKKSKKKKKATLKKTKSK